MVRKLFSIKIFYSILPLSKKSVRFDAFTWEYFSFPHKLSDPGTIWNEYDNKEKATKLSNRKANI
jgi:hypothetical protein